MAKRKPKKQVEFRTFLNPPDSRGGEVNLEASVITQGIETDATKIVNQFLKGDYRFNTVGRYDDESVLDIPVQRRKGASIPSVTNAIKDELVSNAIAKDIASKKAQKELAEGKLSKGEARGSEVSKETQK